MLLRVGVSGMEKETEMGREFGLSQRDFLEFLAGDLDGGGESSTA